jgi:hypothetical protein
MIRKEGREEENWLAAARNIMWALRGETTPLPRHSRCMREKAAGASHSG